MDGDKGKKKEERGREEREVQAYKRDKERQRESDKETGKQRERTEIEKTSNARDNPFLRSKLGKGTQWIIQYGLDGLKRQSDRE